MSNETAVADAPETKPKTKASVAGDKSITGPIGDLSDIQIASSGVGKTRKKKLSISCKKPGKKAFLYVNPNPDFTILIAGIEMEVEGSLDKPLYMVEASLLSDLRVQQEVQEIRIFTYLTNKGRVGLWPIKMSDNKWCTTAIEIANMAMHQIVRVVPDMTEGCYECEVAEVEPDPPNWEQALEGKTLKDLLNLAFKDTYIDTLDHPVLKELWLSE